MLENNVKQVKLNGNACIVEINVESTEVEMCILK